MRKFKFFAILILAVMITAPAYAEIQDMWATVYRWKGQMSLDGKPVVTQATSNITFEVLQKNSASRETLYEPTATDTGLTSLTNPITTTNYAADTVCHDRVAFRVDPTESGDQYVDLHVVDAVGGYTVFIEDFDKTQHTIIIDERPGVVHHGWIWFTAAASETDTGIDFDYDTLLTDMKIEIITPDSGHTLDVGLLSSEVGGDADGLIKDHPLVVLGLAYDSSGVWAASGSDYFMGTTTYGSSLVDSKAGISGTFIKGYKTMKHNHIRSPNAASLAYTASAVGAAGYIHYWFIRAR